MEDISRARYWIRYSPVHATKWRWELRWRVRFAAIMPVADVPGFFFVFFLSENGLVIWNLSISGLTATLVQYPFTLLNITAVTREF